MRVVDSIVLHTAGAYSPKTQKVIHQSMEDVRRYHIESNGWSDIGYHAFVDRNGNLTYGRPVEKSGAHARYFNKQSLGLCVSGHGDYEEWGPSQLETVISQCTSWCHEYGVKPYRVLGHNETDEHGGPPVYKTCPGKLVDMAAIRAEVSRRMTLAPANIEPFPGGAANRGLRELVSVLEANQRALIKRVEDLEQHKS